MKIKIVSFYNIILLILVLGIYFDYVSMLLCVSLMLIRLFWCSKREIALTMLLIGMPCMGFIFRVIQIPIQGSWMPFIIGSVLSFPDVVKHCLKHLQSVWLLLGFFLLFTCFYFVGPQTEFATNKLFGIYEYGISTFFSFVLLCNFKGINMKTISQFYLMYSLIIISASLNYFDFTPPKNFFDFNFIRSSSVELLGFSERANVIDYQLIGIITLIGCASWLSVERKLNIALLFIVILSFWITLISGARQAIFGMPVILIFWAFVKSEKFSTRQLIFPLLIAFLLFYVLQYVGTDYIQTSLDTSQDFETRIGGRNYLMSINLFLSNPIWGVGLGGIEHITGVGHAHNIILELLCESGLIGLSLCLIGVILHLKKNRISFNYVMSNNALFFVIWVVFMLRAMISLDLTTNIIVISSLLAISESKFGAIKKDLPLNYFK